MLTVHLNGEIVRHPDNKAIRAKIQLEHDKYKKCPFGCLECDCPTYQKYIMERPRERLNLRCGLHTKFKEYIDDNNISWKHYVCPKAHNRYIAAISPKKYKIDWSVYRKISSAAHYMIKESEYKTILLTLTFGKFKNNEITERQANECFSKFTENLKKTYCCQHYIAVRERGERDKRLHYHIICSIPYIDFTVLNSAWNHAIKDFCYFSPCSLRTEKNKPAVIHSPARAIRYICKYFSKNFNNESGTRLVFVSNSLLSEMTEITNFENVYDKKTMSYTVKRDTNKIRQSKIKRQITDRTFNFNDLLTDHKTIQINTYQFVTTFKITGKKEFNKFCNLFLYPLFEFGIKVPELHYLHKIE